MRLVPICCFFCCVFAALPMLGVSALTLPPAQYADTEASTNMQFAIGSSGVGRFTLSLSCIATPSNNVEASFGHDTNLDGVLGLGETEFTIGWDCGAWFVQNGFDGGRVEETAGEDDEQTFVWTVELSPRSAIARRVTATIGGTAGFGGVGAGMFYRKTWNMLRLTGRGLADSGEALTVRVLPDSLFMIMR